MEACWPATASSRVSPHRRAIADERAATLPRGTALTTAVADDRATTRAAVRLPRLTKRLDGIPHRWCLSSCKHDGAGAMHTIWWKSEPDLPVVVYDDGEMGRIFIANRASV